MSEFRQTSNLFYETDGVQKSEHHYWKFADQQNTEQPRITRICFRKVIKYSPIFGHNNFLGPLWSKEISYDFEQLLNFTFFSSVVSSFMCLLVLNYTRYFIVLTPSVTSTIQRNFIGFRRIFFFRIFSYTTCLICIIGSDEVFSYRWTKLWRGLFHIVSNLVKFFLYLCDQP
jgi:hypothetical protein